MKTEFLLALNAHPKIGSQTLKKILAVFPDPAEVWNLSRGALGAKLDDKLVSLILEAREQFDPETERAKLSNNDIGFITIYDKEYPPLLKEIYDAPVLIYVRGSISVLSKSGIGVVGSRKYTNYGMSVCGRLVADCLGSGLTIVSGLALGIDSIAHEAALRSGQLTIGVLGCGLDQIYPASNRQLGQSIIDSGGAVISEFAPGTPPMKQNFPARNRIIAGLSLGILVIEAALKSGALITAYQALEYNREVFAIPGNIDAENSGGTNKLIKEGATLVATAQDIFSVLNIESKNSQKKAKEIFPETTTEKIVCEILKTGEKTINELVEFSSLGVVSLNSAITILEMKGLVSNLGGGRYKIMNFSK